MQPAAYMRLLAYVYERSLNLPFGHENVRRCHYQYPDASCLQDLVQQCNTWHPRLYEPGEREALLKRQREREGE